MGRADRSKSVAVLPPPRTVLWMTLAAVVGLGFAAASSWVHYRILHDPTYSSFCDVSSTFSCTQAYTSRYGAVAGVPVAILGVVYFAFVLVVIALCRASITARQNLTSYVFAMATAGLAGVLYLAYASFFVLKAVCLLCVGTYAAVIALLAISATAPRRPMGSLPGRAASDLQALFGHPAALGAAVAFVAAAVVAVMAFPTQQVTALEPAPASATPAAALPAPPPGPPVSPGQQQQLEQFLAQQPRVPMPSAASGAAVVIYKFNDYQCPACGMTYAAFKPVLARLQQEFPGKIASITRDYPLDPECNATGGSHQAACEAAAAVRMAREKGNGEALEEWLFANQAALTPALVKQGAASVGGVADFDARYPAMLELIKADIALGRQLAVNGTPTYFMNGIRLPNFNRGEFFEIAVRWELRRLGIQ